MGGEFGAKREARERAEVDLCACGAGAEERNCVWGEKAGGRGEEVGVGDGVVHDLGGTN